MVVAIIGGIASGKTAVANYLARKNYPVISSDAISHALLLNEVVKEKLKHIFGAAVFTDKQIDRQKLGHIVFQDDAKRRDLEKALAPYITRYIEDEINALKKSNRFVFLEAPLLQTYGLAYLADKIILIKSAFAIRLSRLIKRDQITRAYALCKIQAQKDALMPVNYTIANDGGFDDLFRQVEAVVKDLEAQR